MRIPHVIIAVLLSCSNAIAAPSTDQKVGLAESKSWHDAINAFPNPRPNHWGRDTLIGSRMNLVLDQADNIEEFRDLLVGLRYKIKNAPNQTVATLKKALAVDCIDNLEQAIPNLIGSLKSTDELYGLQDVHQFAAAIGFNAQYEADKQSPNLKALYRYWHKCWDSDRKANAAKALRYRE